MPEQTTGGSTRGPVLQAPLSTTMPGTPPKNPTFTDAGRSVQPETSGQPIVQTPPTPSVEADRPPAVPGLDETDWVAMPPEIRTQVAPILKKIERGLTSKFQEAAGLKQKAAAWEAAMMIPGVNDALQRYLDGKTDTGQGTPSTKDEAEPFANLEDTLDAKTVQDIVTKSISSAIAKELTPLRQQLSGLTEVVAKRELDSEFVTRANTLPGLTEHRQEVIQLLADGKVQTVEDAYDMIQGRLARTRKPQPTFPQPLPSTPAVEVAQTAVSPEAGPTAGRLAPAKTRGMLEHLRAAMREHQMTNR